MGPRQLISTGSPFEAKWGYSRVVADGDLVFVAGTTDWVVGLDRRNFFVEQITRNVLDRLGGTRPS